MGSQRHPADRDAHVHVRPRRDVARLSARARRADPKLASVGRVDDARHVRPAGGRHGGDHAERAFRDGALDHGEGRSGASGVRLDGVGAGERLGRAVHGSQRPATLVAFQAARRAAGESDSTIRRRWSALSSFYDFVVERDLRAFNPTVGVDRPKVDSRDPSPTAQLSEEAVASYRAAAAALDPRLDALVALLVCDGLKVAEALALNIDDIFPQVAGDNDHRSPARRTETNRLGARQRSSRQAMHWAASVGPRLRQRTNSGVGGTTSADTVRGGPPHPPTPEGRGGRGGRAGDANALRRFHINARQAIGDVLDDVRDRAGLADVRGVRRYDRTTPRPV